MANCLSSLMRDPGNSIIKQRSVYTLNTSCGSREGKLEEICQGTPSFQLAKSRRRIGGLSKLLLGFQVFTENWLVTLQKKKKGGGKEQENNCSAYILINLLLLTGSLKIDMEKYL